MSDVDELTRELDLDAALARTYELGDGLRRRSTARKRWATGAGLVAATVLAALVIPSLGGDDPAQRVGLGGIADGGATTEAPATTRPATSPPTTVPGSAPIPVGYGLRVEGDVWILERQVAVPETTTSWDGGAEVEIGTAAATVRAVAVKSSELGTVSNSISVSFACVAGEQQLDVVRYRVEPTRIVVDAEISYDPGAAGCLPSSEGSTVSLPLPEPFVPGTPIVVEPLHTP